MIIIDDNYAIETDSMGNYSLFRRKKVKRGKTAGTETKDYIGHFSSMRKAVFANPGTLSWGTERKSMPV